MLSDPRVLRARLQSMPPLTDEGLWPAQVEAIRNLERRTVVLGSLGVGNVLGEPS